MAKTIYESVKALLSHRNCPEYLLTCDVCGKDADTLCRCTEADGVYGRTDKTTKHDCKDCSRIPFILEKLRKAYGHLLT